MTKLLQPIKLTPSLEERVRIGDDEFVVGVKNPGFLSDYIRAHMYASRVQSTVVQVPITERRGLLQRKVVVGHETRTEETLEPQFDVRLVIAGARIHHQDVLANLRNEVREKEVKMLNIGVDLAPFYDAVRRFHEHYQGQYEASERVLVMVPARGR